MPVSLTKNHLLQAYTLTKNHLLAYEKPSFSLRKTIFYAYKRLKVNTLQAP